MGLFTGLLTLPLAPVRGAVWVAEQVAEEAERQLHDEDYILSELLRLELEDEEGSLNEDERRRREDELLSRLEASRAGNGPSAPGSSIEGETHG